MQLEVKRVLTTREVCTIYRADAGAVRKMVKEGTLRAGRVGRCLRFSPEECDRVFSGVNKENVEAA